MHISRTRNLLIFILVSFALFSLVNPVLGESITTKRSVGPGCTFTQIIDEEVPLRIYLLKVELQNEYIKLEPVLGQDAHPGREQVHSMSRRYDRPGYHVVGGINADYWRGSTPVGMAVKDGRLSKSSHGWSSIAFTKDNVPLIDIFITDFRLTASDGTEIKVESINTHRNDSNIVLYTDIHGERTEDLTNGKAILLNPHGKVVPTWGSLEVTVMGACPLSKNNKIPKGKWILSLGRKHYDKLEKFKLGEKFIFKPSVKPDTIRIYDAISGGPRILRAGRVSVEREKEGQRTGFDSERHPRTAIGYTEDKRYLIMTVVDGRNPEYSRGVNLYELAELMKELGCYEAINLDGGGSSTMVIRNEVVNRPSDASGPRPVSNGFLIVSTAPDGRLKEISVSPQEVLLATGCSLNFNVLGTDEYYNSVRIDKPVKWSVSRRMGKIDRKTGTFTASTKEGEATITAKVGRIKGNARVIIKEPASLVVEPSAMIPEPGEVVSIDVKAFDAAGQQLIISKDALSFAITQGNIGSISQNRFTAAKTRGNGEITVRLGMAEKAISVRIAEKTTVNTIEDFEDVSDWEVTSAKEQDYARLASSSEKAKQGRFAGKFDFSMERTGGVSALYLNAKNPQLIGRPDRIIFWLYWDGSGHLFRGLIEDSEGDKWLMDFNRVAGLDWQHEWREVEFPISELDKHWSNKSAKDRPRFPIRIKQFYIAETKPQDKGSGTIYLDDLRVQYRSGQMKRRKIDRKRQP